MVNHAYLQVDGLEAMNICHIQCSVSNTREPRRYIWNVGSTVKTGDQDGMNTGESTKLQIRIPRKWNCAFRDSDNSD